ncbi:protein of unknown function [Streptococcus thermophilus]|nr:protein of unknown function [Streptococcus thermophilus]CAD0149948.1 protein of unknown function [Streptococcus thermophilus]
MSEICYNLINKTEELGHFVVLKQDTPLCRIGEYLGSIISVVGKTTVGIIELFECTQKVP